jgi:hypothetical protein
MRALLAAVVIGLAVISRPANLAAHHSFAAEFDGTKPITLKGKLSKMEWVNPHGWLHVDVTQPDGKVVTWAVETGATNALMRRGLRQVDFPIGSDLVVEGFRAKNGSPTANGRSVTFADGRNFFLGATDAPQGSGAPGRSGGAQ